MCDFLCRILTEVKPGRDLYIFYFAFEVASVISILFSYSAMTQPPVSADSTHSSTNLSGSMVLFLVTQVRVHCRSECTM